MWTLPFGKSLRFTTRYIIDPKRFVISWKTFEMKMNKPGKSWYPGGIIFNFSPNTIFRFSKMADQKTWKKEFSTTLSEGFRGWEKRSYEWKFSFFHPKIFSDFPKWWTKKHEKRNFLHYLGVFEVEKYVFMNESFHFFTLTYFPIFQDGGPKNMKKGTFCIT